MNQFLQVCASAALAAVGVGAGWWMRSPNPSDATRSSEGPADVARELAAIRGALDELVRASHHEEGIVAPSQVDRTAVGAPDVASLGERLDRLIQLLEASPQAVSARGASSDTRALDAGPQREHLASLQQIATTFSNAELRSTTSDNTPYSEWEQRFQRAYRCMRLDRLVELLGVPDDVSGNNGTMYVSYRVSDGRTHFDVGFELVGGYVSRCWCADLTLPTGGR